MAITPASQAGDVSSILITRSIKLNIRFKGKKMKDLLGAIAIHLLFAYIIIWLILKISS